MEFVKIDRNYKDFEKLSSLKKEAFPELDDVKVETFIAMQENGDLRAYAVYDKNRLIGYIVFINKDDEVYFLNLAVDKYTRGKGYGSKILTTVMDYFKKINPDTFFFLDVEKPYENARNIEQRKSRIEFYKRLGFYLTDLASSYHNDTYVLMTTEKELENKNHQPFSEYIKNLLTKYDI